jgi:predicted GH43/DUF377 family glycosyl hydrolase
MTHPLVNDQGVCLSPNLERAILRFFVPGQEAVGPGASRAIPVIDRVLALGEQEVTDTLAELMTRFGTRHPDIGATFAAHANAVLSRMAGEMPITDIRRQLMGAVFTHEYSIEGAAICNPSIVVAPKQPNDGSTALILSVRGVGEGHRSSLGFRQATLSAAGVFTIDAGGEQPRTGTVTDLGHLSPVDYDVVFDESVPLADRVLWPHSADESHGIEDARFVRFCADDGMYTYVATATAFDGVGVCQHLISTDDFVSFRVSPLNGAAAQGKGLAIFPRRIDGRYVALSRSDRETNSVVYSDSLTEWDDSVAVQVPEQPWEIIQLGNCGSPIETPAGWLMITHGVGPMRTYSLGALLLDLEHPEHVIGRLNEPLLTPAEHQRHGYVPNVVYSCGQVAVGDQLVIPYGAADQRIGIATVSIEALLARMG